MAECRSCRILIDWANLPEGKTIPVDRDSAGDPNGNLAVRRTAAGTLQARYLKAGEQPEPGEKRGISHFATCPQARQWRSKETDAADPAAGKKAAAEFLNDLYDTLHGRGKHAGHTQQQVGRCVHCSCGMRVQGQLPKREKPSA